MKKLAVYTCISGGYDVLKQPTSVCPDIDYLCFVPRGEKTGDMAGVWRIVEFDVTSAGSVSKSRSVFKSRYPKMMPHLLLEGYEYSLYVDANIDIVSDGFYELVLRKISEGSLLSAPSHPRNDCVFDEAEYVVKCGKDTLWHVLKAVSFLKKEGFPRHFGLYENSVILRRHNDPDVVAADCLWWDLFNRYPRRDQLLLTYCLWKTGIAMDYLFPSGENVRNSPLLSLRGHKFEAKDPANSFWRRKLMTFPKMVIRIWLSESQKISW